MSQNFNFLFSLIFPLFSFFFFFSAFFTPEKFTQIINGNFKDLINQISKIYTELNNNDINICENSISNKIQCLYSKTKTFFINFISNNFCFSKFKNFNSSILSFLVKKKFTNEDFRVFANTLLFSIFERNNSYFINEVLESIREENNNKNFDIENSIENEIKNVIKKSIQQNTLKTPIQTSKNCIPFLPEKDKKYKYTLVLDLDETLIHFIKLKDENENNSNIHNRGNNSIYSNNNSECEFTPKKHIFFLARPYLLQFLYALKDKYEIVVFSAGNKEYCDEILDLIENAADTNNIFNIIYNGNISQLERSSESVEENNNNNNDNNTNNNISNTTNYPLIKYRLYRQHMTLKSIETNVKDLSLLGREINKMLIIDNLEENFKLQPDNGLLINTWTGDVEDRSLIYLCKLLLEIHKRDVSDIRSVIRKVKKKVKNANYNKLNIDELFK